MNKNPSDIVAKKIARKIAQKIAEQYPERKKELEELVAISYTSILAEKIAEKYPHERKPFWNFLAISYAVLGYAGGIGLLLSSNLFFNIVGVLLLTHSWVIAAYLAHEFMHYNIYEERNLNNIGGNLVLWLTGSCYGRFEDLAKHHTAHHVKRVDLASSMVPDMLNKMPGILRRFILILEWLYFPAISLIVQWKAIINPFFNPKRYDERRRIIILLVIRGLLFTLLGIVSLKALLLYFFAYIGFLTILRVVDAFHHTYEVFLFGSKVPRKDFDYEKNNTFSTLISKRFWWINLLLLNFGYHNAHHTLMTCPWHSLHELDREINLDPEKHYLSLWEALGNYHRFRMTRIFSDGGNVLDEQGKLQMEDFHGGVGISFLVVLHT